MVGACLKNQDDPRVCLGRHHPAGQWLILRGYWSLAALSPWDGDIDRLTREKMDMESMSCFLRQVCKTHPYKFHVINIDGASFHKGKRLEILPNVLLSFFQHILLRWTR